MLCKATNIPASRPKNRISGTISNAKTKIKRIWNEDSSAVRREFRFKNINMLIHLFRVTKWYFEVDIICSMIQIEATVMLMTEASMFVTDVRDKRMGCWWTSDQLCHQCQKNVTNIYVAIISRCIRFQHWFSQKWGLVWLKFRLKYNWFFDYAVFNHFNIYSYSVEFPNSKIENSKTWILFVHV